MFGLGMMEIGLIIVIAVMLFPPTELPKLIRSIARIYGQVRRTAEDFRNTVLEDEDLREPIDQIKGAYNDARWEVRDAERKARQQLAKAQMDLRMATARRLQAEREAEAKGEAASPAVAPPAVPASRAASAGPVRIAASNHSGDEDEDDANDRPVAASDPRVISPHARSRAEMTQRPAPPSPQAESAEPAKADQQSRPVLADGPREGVG